MPEGTEPQNFYERKLKLILDFALKRFSGNYTPEQYQLELRAAKNMLAQLGVKP